jgi:hypothetical protein
MSSDFANLLLRCLGRHPIGWKERLIGSQWRRDVLRDTINILTDGRSFPEMEQQAWANVNRWRETASPPPQRVEVVCDDWGVTCHAATRHHGVVYTVLNMANGTVAAGGLWEGGSAQEENLFLRSSALLSLRDTSLCLFDHQRYLFRYTDRGVDLLTCHALMDQEESSRVISQIGSGCDGSGRLHKTLLFEEARVCFRGPEVHLDPDPDFMGKNLPSNDILSFSLLPRCDIFPFYELRTASPVVSRVGGRDVVVLEEMRRRIRSQLHTLILNGRRHVILGGFGCGEHGHDAHSVGRVYAEELLRVRECFSHVIFPVLTTHAFSENFSAFHSSLHNLPLAA